MEVSKNGKNTIVFPAEVLFYKFSLNLLIRWIDEARVCAKQSLLSKPWPLPPDQEIQAVGRI